MTERLVTDLPEPELADQRQGLAGADRQVEVLHGGDRRAAPIRKTVLRPEMSRIGSATVAMAFSSGESPAARRIASTFAASSALSDALRPGHRRWWR